MLRRYGPNIINFVTCTPYFSPFGFTIIIQLTMDIKSVVAQSNLP